MQGANCDYAKPKGISPLFAAPVSAAKGSEAASAGDRDAGRRRRLQLGACGDRGSIGWEEGSPDWMGSDEA